MKIKSGKTYVHNFWGDVKVARVLDAYYEYEIGTDNEPSATYVRFSQHFDDDRIYEPVEHEEVETFVDSVEPK